MPRLSSNLYRHFAHFEDFAENIGELSGEGMFREGEVRPGAEIVKCSREQGGVLFFRACSAIFEGNIQIS